MKNKFKILLLITGIVALISGCGNQQPVPSYLKGYESDYYENPRQANLKWFTNAKYGMFIHYGLYALLEKGEWVQLRDTIPVAEYAMLKDSFTAEKFDADLITDLAQKANMEYITITSKHHDGFCLFETKATDFNVLNSPAKRDLIRELYDACERKGLGLFLYYSYGADWKHPYFYPRESGWQHARPAYPNPQPEYKFENEEDFNIYVDFVHDQLTELLTQYPNIAGIWFDPIMGFYSRPELFPVDSTYALVRSLSPHALISFKQGANGSEDFMAPERKGGAVVGQQFDVARQVYEMNKDKPKEICNTLQPHAWGYNKLDDGQHRSAEDVLQMLEDAREMNANLLLNIGPKGDGSIPDEDIVTLTQVGERILANAKNLSAHGTLEENKSPNILCILVDDLGYGDLSCQGAIDLLTPNIDRLGEQGLTFKNFYANCPVCSPSRASLLTGKYPDLVGVPGVIRQFEDNSWGYLDPDAVLLPVVLKKKGYQTAIIGKWHLGFEEPNVPNSRGFDYFKGFLGDMMDDYWTHLRGGVNWMRFNKEVIDPKGHATDLFTDWAIEYMKERVTDKPPFFLYLAYNAPHFPIQPPVEYLEKVLVREKSIDERRAKNVAFIEHLDHSIGRIIKCLEETGLIENTLVVFTSDNGGSIPHAQSNGTLHGGKQQMFEGGIKVPALAVWKGKIQPGSQTENMALLMDLYPSFCKIAGADLYHEVDGVDVSATIFGKPQNTDNRFVFWVRREGGQRYNGQSYYAARYGPYKMLQNSPFEPYQYYNLKDDPLEQEPLDPEISGDFARLRKELQSHIQESGSIPWQEK